MSNAPLPKPHRKPLPLITDGDPVVPQEVKDKIPVPEPHIFPQLPMIDEWRRYDRSIFGLLIQPDGSKADGVEKIPGLVVTIRLKGPEPCWLCMDDGNYYRLGNRAYAGT